MEDPYTFDLVRIFIGDYPLMMFVEILLRTVLMYCYTFALMRVLGKRESGSLSPFELVIVISLGSAVGDPMFYPDVPLLHGFAVITTIVLLQRVLEQLTNRNPKVERVVEGKVRILVKDGVVDKDNLEYERLSTRELYSALRSQDIANLAEVHRAYFEPSGDISVIRAHSAKYGLSLLPEGDPDAPNLYKAGEPVAKETVLACISCGKTMKLAAGERVPTCNPDDEGKWTEAVMSEV